MDMGHDIERDNLSGNVDALLSYATKVTQLKDAIHKKAKINIDQAQAKDKIYYDKKHADTRVRNSVVESIGIWLPGI